MTDASTGGTVRARIMTASAAGGSLASLTMVPISFLAGDYTPHAALGLGVFFMALALVRFRSIGGDTDR